MYLHWTQNGKQRIWNLSEKGITRKLRKALKRNVLSIADKMSKSNSTILPPQYSSIMQVHDKLCRAKNIADLHLAIYPLIGSPEFESFEIRSDI